MTLDVTTNPIILVDFVERIPLLLVIFPACLRSLLSTMMSNLGDLLNHGYLGIVELPVHSYACQLRMNGVRFRHFRLL